MIRHKDYSGPRELHELTVLEIERGENGTRILTVMDCHGDYAVFHLRHSSDLSAAIWEARGEITRCTHENTEPRMRTASNGRIMVSRQCLNCGNNVGKFLKKEFWPDQPEPWDDEIEAELRARADAAELPVLLRYVEIQQEEQQKYSQYLLSPEWRRKRKLVLERDKGLCQGCLTAPATEVHHITYRNIFDEFAFQLTSLCSPCHERYHDDAGDPEV